MFYIRVFLISGFIPLHRNMVENKKTFYTRVFSVYPCFLYPSSTVFLTLNCFRDADHNDVILRRDVKRRDVAMANGAVTDHVFAHATDKEEERNADGVSSHSSGSGGSQKQPPEPNIDFELDIKIEVDSGQWVLHPKNEPDDDGNVKRRRGERPNSGEYPAAPTSPVASKKKLKKQENTSSAKLFSQQSNPQQQSSVKVVDRTIFHLPGVDVKVGV